jgi:hypothetical protein
MVARIYSFGSSLPTVPANSGGISCTVKFSVPDHVSGTSFFHPAHHIAIWPPVC